MTDGIVKGWAEEPFPKGTAFVVVTDANRKAGLGTTWAPILLIPDDGSRVVVSREEWEAVRQVLDNARSAPTWAVFSETDSSAHHHSERRADQYAKKVNDWIGKVDAARTILGTPGGGE